MTAVELQRIDPARNMRRFYRLDIEPDLFGGVLLMKEWGRIGARGRVVALHFDSQALAATALERQAGRKKRKGYAIIEASR
ncbi:WGR domain-containing protein [Methylocystis iwaonis]|uniref:WGR domain-containing protein n=1 Tax=Methylocystis iwaonis TaxID=2885079 RepID=UPI0024929547|nr:WGR domain-containing protein [Methylocystis iwaonis]